MNHLFKLIIIPASLMSSSFKLIAGNYAKKLFDENYLLKNPLTGLMIGVLVTLLVQSSSTSTSIVVNLVASDIINVRTAIPIIMGANIGTNIDIYILLSNLKCYHK